MTTRKFTADDVPAMAHHPESAEVSNSANTAADNSIACPEGDKPMLMNSDRFTKEDLGYIRNMMAEGIARALVEKVAKNTASAVDKSEPERYTHSPLERGGTFS